MHEIEQVTVTRMTIEPSRSFEEAFARLETVMTALRNGPATLDEALALYEEGVQLARYCHQILENAELRVRQLAVDQNGHLSTEPFDA
jgi:exodeoxyribonuclease VII small subunit